MEIEQPVKKKIKLTITKISSHPESKPSILPPLQVEPDIKTKIKLVFKKNPIITKVIPLPKKEPTPILKQVILKPFWSEITRNWSHNLWSPTKNNCVDIDPDFEHNKTLKSWFSVKCQKHVSCCPPTIPIREIFHCPSPTIMKTQIATRKIRLFPGIEDKIFLKKLFGACRYVYNHGLDFLNDPKNKSCNQAVQGLSMFQRLRERFSCQYNYEKEGLTWLLDNTTYDTRDYIIKELYKNYKNGFKTGRHFALKKRKRNQTFSIPVRVRAWEASNGFFGFLKQIRTSEIVPNLTHDFQLHCDENGHYFLLILCNQPSPIMKKMKKTVHKPRRHVYMKRHHKKGIRHHRHHRRQMLNHRKNKWKKKKEKVVKELHQVEHVRKLQFHHNRHHLHLRYMEYVASLIVLEQLPNNNPFL